MSWLMRGYVEADVFRQQLQEGVVFGDGRESVVLPVEAEVLVDLLDELARQRLL